MKKIILLILAVLIFILAFSKSGIAQEDDINIGVEEYNLETNFVRIQIYNDLSYDLHNVKYQLGSLSQKKLTDTFEQGTATGKTFSLKPGTYTFTVFSDEITTTKELVLQKSFKESLKEYEEARVNVRREVQREKSIESEITKNSPIKEGGKNYTKPILIAIPIIVIIGIIVYILTKKKDEI
ncbi:hypothetical protein CL614_08440 [archaeon]|nr:hypothetical protein [archaeon]|tara:strand:- start:675 stop:1220 length:546 start_codon:yes stop_codon:yes gene_type:complete